MNAPEQSGDSLDAIEPVDKVIRIAGNDIRIRPLTIGQLPGFVRAISPALPSVEALVRFAADGEITRAEVEALLVDCEGLIEAVRIGAGLDAKFFNAQTLDVLVDTAIAVLNVNSAFFAQRTAPAVAAVLRGVISEEEAAGTIGTGSSSSSSAPASAATR